MVPGREPSGTYGSTGSAESGHPGERKEKRNLSIYSNRYYYNPSILQYIIPLEPEQAMSIPTYDLFGTETKYKRKLELCQNGS